MRNVGLLRFLAAVQCHNNTTTTLLDASGFDACELQIAVAAAEEAGFIEATGKVQPSLVITAAGRDWVRQELAPFFPLLQAAMKGGV